MLKSIFLSLSFFVFSCGAPTNQAKVDSSGSTFWSDGHYAQFLLENGKFYNTAKKKQDIASIKTMVLCFKGKHEAMSVSVKKSSDCGCTSDKETMSLSFSHSLPKDNPAFTCYQGSVAKKLKPNKKYTLQVEASDLEQFDISL